MKLNDMSVTNDIYRRIEKLEAENKKLKDVIAQSPNENDDLGAEYTHVVILKDKNEKLEAQNKIMRSALEFYADDENVFEIYWNHYGFRNETGEEDIGKTASHALEKVKELDGKVSLWV